MPAWSYTSLTGFENCPRRHYEIKVAKNYLDPPGEEALWGQRVHSAMENRLKTGEPIIGNLAAFEPYAKRVADMPGTLQTEQKIALTENLEPTGWFAKNVWLRAVLDAIVLKDDSAFILDWKTGKRKPDSDQLRLFAGVGFAVYPYIARIKTAFVWLKAKAIDSDQYEAEQKGDIWRVFLPRVERFMEAHEKTNFPPKPSGLCKRWCPVTSCEFHGK